MRSNCSWFSAPHLPKMRIFSLCREYAIRWSISNARVGQGCFETGKYRGWLSKWNIDSVLFNELYVYLYILKAYNQSYNQTPIKYLKTHIHFKHKKRLWNISLKACQNYIRPQPNHTNYFPNSYFIWYSRSAGICWTHVTNAMPLMHLIWVF